MLMELRQFERQWMLLLIMLANLWLKHILNDRLVVKLLGRLLNDLFLFNDEVVAVIIAIAILLVVAAARVISMIVVIFIMPMIIIVIVMLVDIIHAM